MYDIIGNMISFEDGELSDIEVLQLFSHLIKTGQCWSLQGSYGRAAATLIKDGYIDRDSGTILKDVPVEMEGI